MPTATKKKTSLKRAGKHGKGRDPKFTALENKIITAEVKIDPSVTKALAISKLRELENAGMTPEEVAGSMRFEQVDGGKLGKPQPTDAAADQKFQDTLEKLGAAGDGTSDGPDAQSLDDLLAEICGEGPDDDDD